MSSFLSPLQQLAKAYPGLTSAKRLQAYTKSRLPAELSSRGELIPIGGGTGRIPFALGDELIVKTARMPRGMMENTMEGDWVAPVPEAVWKSDDDAVAVVKRALPADAKLKRTIKAVRPALSNAEEADSWLRNYAPSFLKTPEGREILDTAHERFAAREAALDMLDWSSLLNYDPLWGDIAPRNVGLKPSAERTPLLLDAGILNRNIMEPRAVREAVSPADWAAYRRDVLRAKKEGGPAKMAGGGLMQAGARLSRAALDKGFHTVGYHGTRVDRLVDDILRGDISPHTTYDRALGPHIAKDPRVTNAFTVGAYARDPNPWLYKGDPRALWDAEGSQILGGGNTIPVALRGKYKKVKGDSQWGELRDQITEGIGADEDLFSNWFSKVRQVPLEEASKIYRAFGKGDPVVLGRGDLLMSLDDITKMAEPGAVAPHRFRAKDDIFGTDLAGYDTPGQIMRNYDAYGYGLSGKEKKALVENYRKRLSKEGYSGVEYQNESPNEIRGDFDPTTFIVSDPNAIRSLFAEFRRNGAGLGRKEGGLAQCR